MLGVKATVHLTRCVQLPRQFTAGLEDLRVLLRAQFRPTLQQRIQIVPTIQSAGQQDCPDFSIDLSLAVERRFQRRNAQFLIADDVTEFMGKARFAERCAQSAGHVIALAFQVEALPLQVQPKHAAPAPPTGIGLIHRFELLGPERIERTETMSLKQRTVLSGQEISHSRPSKNLTTCRIRFLSAALSRVRLRYCR
ncbi:hypothetical protein D3C84_807840 [compost metagenome]